MGWVFCMHLDRISLDEAVVGTALLADVFPCAGSTPQSEELILSNN